jgi:hypothetical protein
MGAKITNAKLTIETLINAGFRSTANALAELVDNSIEAEAQQIRIIAWNKRSIINTRSQNNIAELAVLDDGTGMNISDLGNCLSLGWGTRLDSREGLGRFGFGLKGSSISQCRLIEVYSWQDGLENCHKSVMDINKIYEYELEELPDAEPARLPKHYMKYFKGLIGDSGTLVRWQNLVHVDVKKTDALVRRLNNDLCRIYRHFLDDDNTYGTKRDIRVVSINLDDGSNILENVLLPNDPLYILTPHNIPDHPTPLFSMQENHSLEIQTLGGCHTVQFISSVAKPESQMLGGASLIGKHCSANTGISFVRACREIDFGDFGFIDSYDPRNRWWGIEVRFSPKLDEIFGVTNNKQHVRNVKFLTDSRRNDLIEIIDLNNKDFDHYKAKALIDIDKQIERLVKDLMRVVKTRGEGRRTPKDSKVDTTSQVNSEVKKDLTPTKSDVEAEKKSDEDKKRNLVELFKNSDQSLSDKQVEDLASITMDHKVDLSLDSWPGKLFLDIQFPANGAVGVLNREHNFYDVFWDHLSSADDPKGHQALKIMLMAYVRAEDETSRRHSGPYYEDLRDSWGKWCDQLLDIAN